MKPGKSKDKKTIIYNLLILKYTYKQVKAVKVLKWQLKNFKASKH